jgi:carbon-monoxide dehydrogenase medium subunit
MLPPEFQFFAPTDLPEAIGLLDRHAEEGAKVLAGGMSMVPAINLGVLRPTALISLNHVSGLDGIEDDADALRVGALVRHERIATDPLLAEQFPLIAEAARRIADVQVRNRGTVGGSIAHADPSADYLPVLCALDATVTLASPSGKREVQVRDFVLDVMLTALAANEILVAVRVPKLPAGAGSAYVRLARVEGSFALANAAAVVAGGRATVAVGGAVPVPVVFEADANDLDAVGSAAWEACEDAYGDLNGSAEYRRELARVYAIRAVEQAHAEAGA